MISRFHISTTRRRQSHGRMGRSVRRTSSVTMPTASSSIAAGSTKAAQLRLARGRPESLSRPCVRLRPSVWRRLTKRRLSAARSNGRTHKTEPHFQRFPKDRYRTEVESWRELQSQNIEFTMKRLREPVEKATEIVK